MLPSIRFEDHDLNKMDSIYYSRVYSNGKAFIAKNIKAEWDVDLYGELLKTGGGKERMTRYFNEVGWPDTVSSDAEKEKLVKDLHKLKTDLFQVAVESGLCPIRPGGKRDPNIYNV